VLSFARHLCQDLPCVSSCKAKGCLFLTTVLGPFAEMNDGGLWTLS